MFFMAENADLHLTGEVVNLHAKDGRVTNVMPPWSMVRVTNYRKALLE